MVWDRVGCLHAGGGRLSEILSLKGDSYRLKDRDLGPGQVRPRTKSA